jgi:thioredoxin reductase (NADPH)
VIVLVDDDSAELAAMERALARRFGADYRVYAQVSAAAALDEMARLRAAGAPIALVIADHGMDEMNGRALLGRAHEIDPEAKRALLVAWGDRSSAPAILEGCAFGELDNYLTKPWSPPEVYLYPGVGEFLAEWTRAHGPH